jgi:uncharacterized protein (TIGR04222 family)
VLDLRGPDFLAFYLVLLAGVTMLAAFLRWFLRGPSEVGPSVGSIDAYDAAYLAGGPRMAVDAAIASLLHAGRITIHLGTGLKRSDAGVFGLGSRSTLDQSIFDAIASQGFTITRLHSSSDVYTRRISDRLEAAGLVPSSSKSIQLRLAPAALVLPALLIGIAKIGVGIMRGRPVGILVFFCLLTVVVMLLFLSRTAYRTRAGSKVLRRLRKSNAALATSARTAPDRLTHGDIALAFALFGPTVLTGKLITLRQALWPLKTHGTWGCSSGAGCGGGGGGCGGGGGGGGGGCGGCGGGGH